MEKHQQHQPEVMETDNLQTVGPNEPDQAQGAFPPVTEDNHAAAQSFNPGTGFSPFASFPAQPVAQPAAQPAGETSTPADPLSAQPTVEPPVQPAVQPAVQPTAPPVAEPGVSETGMPASGQASVPPDMPPSAVPGQPVGHVPVSPTPTPEGTAAGFSVQSQPFQPPQPTQPAQPVQPVQSVQPAPMPGQYPPPYYPPGQGVYPPMGQGGYPYVYPPQAGWPQGSYMPQAMPQAPNVPQGYGPGPGGFQQPYGPAAYPQPGYPYPAGYSYGQTYPAPGYGYPAQPKVDSNLTLIAPAQPSAAMGADADLNTPVMRLGGQPMNLIQYTHVKGYPSNKALLVALGVLAGLMGLVGLSMLTTNGSDFEIGLLFLVGLVICGLSATGLLIWRSRQRKMRQQQYAAYWEAHAEGVVTDLYPNRIEQYSRHCKTVLYFQPDTEFIQSRDMLVFKNPLPDGDSQIVTLRAQDLTLSQAQELYTHVYHACAPENRRMEGAFLPQRVVPLPVPAFDLTPQLVEGIPPLSYQPAKGKKGAPPCTPPLLMASPIFGTLFASIFAYPAQFTNSYILNWLIWFGGITLLAVVASLTLPRLLSRPRGNKVSQPVQVHMAVVQQGLVVYENGIERFYSPARVRFSKRGQLLRLVTPDKTYDIPFSQVPPGWEIIYNR